LLMPLINQKNSWMRSSSFSSESESCRNPFLTSSFHSSILPLYDFELFPTWTQTSEKQRLLNRNQRF
ncbi:MAG TPA: hypothetical protein VGO47_04100, partial [Chlamydiales bacterium]|nr:hypothetical protein [Chlamydiales bacterium]